MKTLLAALTVVLAAGCGPGTFSSPFGLHEPEAARLPSTSPYPALKHAIDELLPDSLFPPSNAAIRIVSLTQGETLYDLNGELTLNARLQSETLYVRMRPERTRPRVSLPHARVRRHGVTAADHRPGIG